MVMVATYLLLITYFAHGMFYYRLDRSPLFSREISSIFILLFELQ